MTEERPVRILLVEDHPIVRLGLATLLNAQNDLTVVAETEGVIDALEAIDTHRPGLVILPLRLGGAPAGLELCREITSLDRAPQVFMYTSFSSANDATMAFLSGADSFLTKDHPERRLLETIRATARGRKVWDTTVDTSASALRLGETLQESGLTSREQEVLGFMLQRYTNAEIARELFISLPTVKTHAAHILRKLGLGTRKELFN